VRDGLVAVADAAAIYGVVVDLDKQAADRAATENLRAELSGADR
jgi:hypothetical protein